MFFLLGIVLDLMFFFLNHRKTALAFYTLEKSKTQFDMEKYILTHWMLTKMHQVAF